MVRQTIKLTNDILRGLNATVWGGVENGKKASTIFKTTISGTDVIIGVSNAVEDIACNDPTCATLDIIGSVSSALGIILGNLPPTKKYTVVTGSITGVCRTVRYICKNDGTFWTCTTAIASKVKDKILK